jgi:hypothetical protein
MDARAPVRVGMSVASQAFRRGVRISPPLLQTQHSAAACPPVSARFAIESRGLKLAV